MVRQAVPAACGGPRWSRYPLQPMEVHGGADIHCSPWRSMVEQISTAAHGGPRWSRYPLQPMEVHGGADLHCSPWRSTVEQISTAAHGGPRRSRWMPEGACDPVESPWWSRLLAGPVALWREELTLEQVCCQGLDPTWKGPTLEQSVPEGLHPMEETHAGAVGEELQPMGRTHAGAVRGGLSPVGGTPGWSREECEESSPEEEGAAETSSDELTAAPIPKPLHR
ncbi:uncharacterized protein LOC142414491 [Mycteria americana]|uniref:uncharacterized protein LOC142414491 n=1 Tax=Mycteria americana TaxID=33587 RepID=UPI003F5806D3